MGAGDKYLDGENEYLGGTGRPDIEENPIYLWSQKAAALVTS